MQAIAHTLSTGRFRASSDRHGLRSDGTCGAGSIPAALRRARGHPHPCGMRRSAGPGRRSAEPFGQQTFRRPLAPPRG